MNQREFFLLFCLPLPFEILLVMFVFARDLHRRLPFFSAYATVAFASTVAVVPIIHYFGFRSVPSYYAAWIANGVVMIARCFAVAELCRYGLRVYQGIWAVFWRFLTLLGLIFFAHAALDAWGQPNRLVIYGLTFERDINVASVVILISLLLVRKYYGLALEPLHRQIAAGVLLYCVVDTVNDTMLRDLFTGYLFSWFSTDHITLWPVLRPQIDHVYRIWSAVRVSSFIISISIWCFALRKPLPAPVQDPVLLPAEVYGELSPAINLRLRAFNDRLVEMLEP
jgi:hypothetical protein